jgi:hypothetical protein
MSPLVGRWIGPLRLRSLRMVLLVMAATTIALAGVLVLYLQGQRSRVNTPSAPPKAASSCDTPPAPAPPPPAPKQSAGESAAAQAAPPNFLTFAACDDAAKTPAKPKSR